MRSPPTITSPTTETGTVESIYNGLAAPAWDRAGKPNGRGQRRLSFAALRKIPVTDDHKLSRRDTVVA